MPVTPVLGLPYPTSLDTADVPRDLQALALAIEAQSVLPPGVLQMWLGVDAPTGWAICNGTGVDAAANPKLTAVLGSAGGIVTLPDLTDRFPAGPGALNGALNAKGGAPDVKLSAAQSGMPAHNPVISDPGHAHAANGVGIFAGGGGQEFITPNGTDTNAPGNPIRAALTGITAAVAAQNAALPHENRPLYLAVNFIIKLG